LLADGERVMASAIEEAPVTKQKYCPCDGIFETDADGVILCNCPEDDEECEYCGDEDCYGECQE